MDAHGQRQGQGQGQGQGLSEQDFTKSEVVCYGPHASYCLRSVSQEKLTDRQNSPHVRSIGWEFVNRVLRAVHTAHIVTR